MPTEEQIQVWRRGNMVSHKVWEWLQHQKSIRYVPWVLNPENEKFDPQKALEQRTKDDLLQSLEETIMKHCPPKA